MSLNIKQFKVSNTTTGKVFTNGRFNASVLNTIKSYEKIVSGTTDEVPVPGTPLTISSGGLQGNAHMSTQYIKITRNPGINNNEDTIYIPDGIIRIVYISGICFFANTLLYSFTDNLNTSINDLTWNVAFAKRLSQTYGDFIDIPLPNTSLYPKNMYLALIILVNVWESRTIVSGNTCSISSTNADYNVCIDPNKSITDNGRSHFIIIQGKNSQNNIYSHIVVGIEDKHFSQSDRDYNDFSYAIGSRSITSSLLNDTSLS